MTETREFDLADILSITTGRLLSHRHIDGVYEILAHMTGDPIWTHQLGTAADACKPALLEQHPRLAEITVPEDVSIPDLEQWIAETESVYGYQLPVTPLEHWEHLGLLDGIPSRLKANTVICPRPRSRSRPAGSPISATRHDVRP